MSEKARHISAFTASISFSRELRHSRTMLERSTGLTAHQQGSEWPTKKVPPAFRVFQRCEPIICRPLRISPGRRKSRRNDADVEDGAPTRTSLSQPVNLQRSSADHDAALCGAVPCSVRTSLSVPRRKSGIGRIGSLRMLVRSCCDDVPGRKIRMVNIAHFFGRMPRLKPSDSSAAKSCSFVLGGQLRIRCRSDA